MNYKKLLKKFNPFKSNRAVVLMYHRINDIRVDPWQLAVNPQNFDEQLQVLKKKYKVIQVVELAEQIKKGRISSNQVCITFDDGYLDNYENAKPLLQKYNCPATFFIASHFIVSQQSYWWDELQSIILETPALPQNFSIAIHTETLTYNLENNGILSEDQKQKHEKWIWPATPPTQRAALYLALWERMKPLPLDEIVSILISLNEIALIGSKKQSTGSSMNAVQLKDLSDEPLFKIGLHTATHPDLSSHSIEFQKNEICKNKEGLEHICDHVIDTISYPYGAHNPDTISVVSDLRLQSAFTTKASVITIKSPVYRLGRYQVLNINGEAFEKELSRIFRK